MTYYQIKQIGEETRSVGKTTDLGAVVSIILGMAQNVMFGCKELDKNDQVNLRRAYRRMAISLGLMVEEAMLGIETHWSIRQDRTCTFTVTKMHGDFETEGD